MKNKGVFITATDTGAGKSMVTGLLAWYLCKKGYKAITQKWVQTGDEQDIDIHLGLMGKKKHEFKNYIDSMVSYRFKLPASPHLAGEHEGKRIRKDRIIKDYFNLCEDFDFVVVEGTGGALVPYNRKKLLIDIAQELNLPVLVVAQNKLGAINHTLLTVEAIRKRGMQIIGIIFNSPPDKVNEIMYKDNLGIIKALSNERILGTLEWTENYDELYESFMPSGIRFLRWMNGLKKI